MLILASNNASAGGDITIIHDTTDLDTNWSDNRIVMDYEGNYYTIFKDQSGGANHEYHIYKSTDSGDTWTELRDFTQSNNNERGLDICIDSNDIIHIIFSEYFGSSYLYYRTYNTNTETLSGYTILDTDTLTDSFDSFDIKVDYSNNVFVAYNNDDDNEIAFIKYNAELETWGSEQQMYVETDNIRGIAMDTDADRDVYVSFIQQDAVNGNDLMIARWDNSESDFDYEKIADLTQHSGEDYTDIGIDQNGVIHIAYCFNVTDGDLQINYTYGNFGSTWYDEQIYFSDTYSQYDPSLSISNDDIVHIVWTGNNADLGGRDGIIGVRGNYNNWSDLVYYAWDGSDSIMKTSLFYQNFPSTLNPQTGIIGIADNSSEHQAIFYDYGIMLSDTPPSEYEECASPNRVFVITKQFDEGTNYIYMNETGQFYIEIDYLAGLGDVWWRILNSTDTVVQSGIIYIDGADETELIFFTPELYMGTGLYSIDMTWSSSGWDGVLTPLICPFEVLSSDAVGNWAVKTDKSQYDYYAPNNIVDLYVKIPINFTGRVDLRLSGSDTTIKTISGLGGTGTFVKHDNYLTLGSSNRDKTYILYLYNNTNLSNVILEDTYSFRVGISTPTPPTPVEQEEIDFWIGLGLILVFIFIGIGVSTKLDSDAQLGIILLFGTIGGIVSAYYSLVPAYAPFLIGLILVGYIVSSLFGGKR